MAADVGAASMGCDAGASAGAGGSVAAPWMGRATGAGLKPFSRLSF